MFEKETKQQITHLQTYNTYKLIGLDGLTVHLHVVTTEVLVDLLEEDEGENGVGTDTEEVGSEALPEGKDTLVLDGGEDAVKGTLVLSGSGGLETGLDDIEREGGEGAEETGDQGADGVETDAIVLDPTVLVSDDLLSLSVAAELDGSDDAGSAHAGDGADPEGLEAFLLVDSPEGLEGVSVATALLGRETAIGGHTDEDDLGGVADVGTADTTGNTGEDLLAEGGVLASVSSLNGGDDVAVDAETNHTVGDLTEDGGGVALVEGEGALSTDDLHEAVEGSGVELLAVLTTELHTGLAEIHRLDDGGGAAGGESAIDVVGLAG